jgi:hypothetical protein
MVVAFKILGSFIVGMVGLFMLIRGKKTQNTGLMIWGAVLLLLSYLLFM